MDRLEQGPHRAGHGTVIRGGTGAGSVTGSLIRGNSWPLSGYSASPRRKGPKNDTADWTGARSAIRVQGRLWRELLTGEKAARDILSLSDYLAAGRRGTIELLWRFWWVITGAALLTGGIIYAGSNLHGVPDLVRVVGSIAWLAGAAGLFSRGAGAVLGQGLSHAEGWLWQTELDGSVALAATCLPPGAKKSPVGGSSVGRLIPDPNRATQQRRDQLRREADESTLAGTDS